MPTDLDPIVDIWYRHLDKGQEFRVVALDESAGDVELEYFDGTVEAVDIDSWYELDIEAIEPPESWAGALDIETPDLDVGITETSDEDWRAPQDELRHPDERTPLIGPEDEDEGEWNEGPPQEEPPSDER